MKWHGPERQLPNLDINQCDILITSYAILRRDVATKLKDIEILNADTR